MLTINEQPQVNKRTNLKLILSAVASVGIMGAATSVIFSKNGSSQTNSKYLDMFPDEFSVQFDMSRYNKYDNWKKEEFYSGQFNKFDDVNGEWSLEGEMRYYNAKLHIPKGDPRASVTYLKDDKFFVKTNETLSCLPEYQQPGYALAKNSLLNAQELKDETMLTEDMTKRINKSEGCKEDSDKIILQHGDYGTILACLNKGIDGVYGAYFFREFQGTFTTSSKKHFVEVPKDSTPIDGYNISKDRDCKTSNKFQTQPEFSDNFNEKYIEGHVNHKFAIPVDNFPFRDYLNDTVERKLRETEEFGRLTTREDGGSRERRFKDDRMPSAQGTPPVPVKLGKGPDRNAGWGVDCFWYHGAGNHKGYRKQPLTNYSNHKNWKKETFNVADVGTSSYNAATDSSHILPGMDAEENDTTIQFRTRIIDYKGIFNQNLQSLHYWYHKKLFKGALNQQQNLGATLYDAITLEMGQTAEQISYQRGSIDIFQSTSLNNHQEEIMKYVQKEMTEHNGSSCHLRMYDMKKDRYYMCLEAFYSYMIHGGSDHEGGVLGNQCGKGYFYFGNTATRMYDNWNMLGETAEYLCGERWCFFGQIRRQVAFTHSYGGMLVMSAFAEEHVKKGPNGVLAMNQPPLKGSPGAEYVHWLCKAHPNTTGTVKGLLATVIWQIGYCVTNTSTHPHDTNNTWKLGLRFQPMTFEFSGNGHWEDNYFVEYKYCGSEACGMVGCGNLPSIANMGLGSGMARWFDHKSAGGLFNGSTQQCKSFDKCYEMKCKTDPQLKRCHYRGCYYTYWGSNNNCRSGSASDYTTTFTRLHDGMVNVSSCKGQTPSDYFNDGDVGGYNWEGDEFSGADYKGTTQGASYITVEQTNHEDGTGVNGNSAAVTRMPINWYVNVIREVYLNTENMFDGNDYICSSYILSNVSQCIAKTASNSANNPTYQTNRNIDASDANKTGFSSALNLGAAAGDDW